jgi:hypothetical protein
MADQAVEAAQIATATAVTLSVRSAIIAEALVYPPRRNDPELVRMVVEKSATMVETYAETWRALFGLWGAAARGAGPLVIARRTRAVLAASARPARRRVKANGRRLAGREA